MALRTPFFGVKVPDALGKGHVEDMGRVSINTMATVIKLAIEYILGSQLAESATNALLEEPGMSHARINRAFALVACIMGMALRHPSLKQSAFKEDLLAIGLEPDLIAALASTVYGERRDALISACVGEAPRCARLEALKWRVDATISTSTLAKVLKPTVTMQMALSDGNVSMFEVPVKHLHELRYSVAQILKEMEILESRNIFKIVD